MTIYYKYKKWKLILFCIAIMIGAGSLIYTNSLVKKLDFEEQKKIELWAKATDELANSGMGPIKNILATRIIQENTTIPIILTNKDGNIIGTRNITNKITENTHKINKRLEKMKSEHKPIEIQVNLNGEAILTQYLYYEDSYLLKQIRFYPIMQLLVIFLFILVSYIAFSKSRKSEQNQVWAGMAKETAHQIGTPLSSIMAWVDILKENSSLKNITDELDKDINRLEVITDRFSKIGSKTKLEKRNLYDLIENTIFYLKNRLSKKIKISINSSNKEIVIPINKVLFQWVIENICKNSVDAMDGVGIIEINIFENKKNIEINIIDSGKGIQKNDFKAIFKPGFTTKKRGWGLGLSLSKRIIEDYHFGKIYIKSSALNKGTILNILLPKN
tara:strand:- start:372 stop:1535 length:1164 start_codon:yes stop_codon:yes gene_type:complete